MRWLTVNLKKNTSIYLLILTIEFLTKPSFRSNVDLVLIILQKWALLKSNLLKTGHSIKYNFKLSIILTVFWKQALF